MILKERKGFERVKTNELNERAQRTEIIAKDRNHLKHFVGLAFFVTFGRAWRSLSKKARRLFRLLQLQPTCEVCEPV